MIFKDQQEILKNATTIKEMLSSEGVKTCTISARRSIRQISYLSCNGKDDKCVLVEHIFNKDAAILSSEIHWRGLYKAMSSIEDISGERIGLVLMDYLISIEPIEDKGTLELIMTAARNDILTEYVFAIESIAMCQRRNVHKGDMTLRDGYVRHYDHVKKMMSEAKKFIAGRI